jgi:uncharacterized protein (DUF433 family)
MTHSYQTHGLLAAAWGHHSSYGYGLFEAKMPSEKIRWICSLRGAECEVKGTRIAVDLVLEELSHNPDIHELLAAHPDLTRDDVQACLAYAQALVTGKEVSPKPPKGARSDAAL